MARHPKQDPSKDEDLQSALKLHRAGDFRQAISEYERILSQTSRQAFVHNKLGLAYKSVREFDTAIEHYERAIELNPDYAEAYSNLGNTLLKMGKIESALEFLESAVKLNREFVPALIGLANANASMGKLETAIAHFESVVGLQADHVEAHFKLGKYYAELGQNDKAIQHLRQTIQIRPDFVDAHNNLGNALNATGQYESAIPCYEKAIELRPDYSNAYNNLAVTLKKIGRADDALAYFEKAIELKPNYAEAYNNLGNALKDLGRGEYAIKYFEKAIKINPGLAEAHNNLALIYQKLNRLPQALEHSHKAIQINPAYAEAHNNLGMARQMLGENDKAMACYEKALQIKPGFGPAIRHLSKLDPERIAPATLEQRVNSPGISDEDAVSMLFALGEIYNSRKEYETAFAYFRRGNELNNKAQRYDHKIRADKVDRLISTYTRSLIDEKASFGIDTRTPVFIVGMPRSGTTLVEQILSSHPQVHGAGELGYLTSAEKLLRRRLGKDLAYPECIALADGANCRRLAEEYMKKIRDEHSADAKFVTDKMPDNFFRVGLIRILFPEAAIIHCRRNAMDTCNSIYFEVFVSDHPYAYDLQALGEFYLEYERIMAHWRTLPGVNLFEIQYEDLIADQEAQSRKMLNYIGLEWDDRCLAFHKNERAILTASNQQVRKPLYKDSIERWKRYSKGLEPLREVLLSGGIDV
jgi:tetratricopeptide (TPR) repeat protein